MTPEELKAIEDRCEKATPVPWEHIGGGRESMRYSTEDGPMRVQVHGVDASFYNSEFIAHARTDIPMLLAEVERLQEDGISLGNEIARQSERAMNSENKAHYLEKENARLRQALEGK